MFFHTTFSPKDPIAPPKIKREPKQVPNPSKTQERDGVQAGPSTGQPSNNQVTIPSSSEKSVKNDGTHADRNAGQSSHNSQKRPPPPNYVTSLKSK